MFGIQVDLSSIINVAENSIIFYCAKNILPKTFDPKMVISSTQNLLVILGIPSLFVFLKNIVYRFAEEQIESSLLTKMVVFAVIIAFIIFLITRNPFLIEGYVTMIILLLFGLGFIAYLINLAVLYE